MKLKKILLIAIPLVGIALIGAGCSTGQADSTEADRVSQQQSVYVDSQPVPTFDWSLERHEFIELYKARNDAVTTYSYVRNLNGQVVFSCKSIGYPLPSNMQLTNPQYQVYSGSSIVLPQPEPNGLFSSPSTTGTYVFCVNSDGTVSPSYFEADVEAHLSPLDSTNLRLSGDGGLKISTKK